MPPPWSLAPPPRSVLDNNSTLFPTAPGAQPDGTYDPNTACVLWGLPPHHPASYMARQCSEGYGGNLCGTCTAAGGRLYACGFAGGLWIRRCPPHVWYRRGTPAC